MKYVIVNVLIFLIYLALAAFLDRCFTTAPFSLATNAAQSILPTLIVGLLGLVGWKRAKVDRFKGYIIAVAIALICHLGFILTGTFTLGVMDCRF